MSALPPTIRLLGMVGDPVAENPIDQMFNTIFAEHGIPLHFAKFHLTDPARLPAVLDGAMAMGFAGLGMTVPYKRQVVPLLDELDESAQGVGACNYITFEDGRKIGHQTDAVSVVDVVREDRAVEGSSVLLLGGGGAARGVGAGLVDAGAARVTVATRRPGQGEEVAQMLAGRGGAVVGTVPWSGPLRCPPGSDIVLNATSAGAAPRLQRLDIDWDTFDPSMLALDIITGPRNTPYIYDAAARGLTTRDGVDVLNHIAYNYCRREHLDVEMANVVAITQAISGFPLRDPEQPS